MLNLTVALQKILELMLMLIQDRSWNKVVHHVHLRKILEGRIFPTSFTRKRSTSLKVRNQDAKNVHFCKNRYSKKFLFYCLIIYGLNAVQ